MAVSSSGIFSQNKHRKKTRPGMGRGTKWGRPSGRYHKKKYRGQGK